MTLSSVAPDRPACGPASKPGRKKLRISNNNKKNSADDDLGALVDCNPGITHQNLTGYCIVFAVFTAGLVSSLVIASKVVAIGPLFLPASVFVWALTYPLSDIVAEVYGRKYAHKMVLGGFVAYAFIMLVIAEAIALPPASVWEKQAEFEMVLGTSFKVMIAVMISYPVTQFFDVFMFGWIRKKTKGKHLWLRNNCSTFISQTMGNIIFVTIVFAGVLPPDVFWKLFTGNLMMRYILVLSDTAIVYAAVYVLYRVYPELKHRIGSGGGVGHAPV